MKVHETRKRRRTTNPFERLDLRIEVSQEEILADLQYPASRRARAAPVSGAATEAAPALQRRSSS